MPAEVGFQKKQPFMAFRYRGNDAEQKFLDGSVFNTLLPSMFPKRLSGAPNSPPKKSLAFAMPRSIHFIHWIKTGIHLHNWSKVYPAHQPIQ